MKKYITPEVEVVEFATEEVTTGVTPGEGSTPVVEE